MRQPITKYIHDGLTFDVTDIGLAAGRTVLMLHGFPEDRHCWAPSSRALADAGYRVLAPDQRGYSPGACPSGRRAYALDHLASDVLALADAAGAGRFDLIGHDWGAVLAWDLAAKHPDRVRSLCALSVPHPRAFVSAFWHSSQAFHSWYMGFFQIPGLPERTLAARGASMLATSLEKGGLDRPTADRYASRATNPRAMTGPINWYRAMPFNLRRTPREVGIPTLFVWGDRDMYVTRAAAEGCGKWVTGQYRFLELPRRTHWLPTTAYEDFVPPLLKHLAAASD